MRMLVVLVLVTIACQKHDDAPATTTTTPSATTSAAASSATPLATIDPTTTVSATSPVVSASARGKTSDEQAAALAKKLESMNIATLGVLGGLPDAGASNIPLDLSSAAGTRNGGSKGDLRFGAGTGSLQPGGPGGGGFGSSAARANGARDH